jgi:hypothetical protein
VLSDFNKVLAKANGQPYLGTALETEDVFCPAPKIIQLIDLGTLKKEY